MKILQLLTSRKSRGAEISAFLLSEELQNNGVEVALAGLFPVESERALTLKSGMSLDLNGDPKVFLDFRLLRKLRNLIKDFKPDVIQANGSDTWKYAVLALTGNSKPKLIYRNISIMSYWFGDRVFVKIIYKLLSKRVDYFCSVGRESNADLVKLLGIEESRAGVVRRGIPYKLSATTDRSHIREMFGIGQDDFLVIQVGHLSPEKNLDFSLDIIASVKLSIPKFKFLIVGRGKEEISLRSRVDELNLSSTVVFAGYHEEVGKMLFASDLLLLTSKIEGVPGVVLEAAFQGIPAVASDVGGVSETIMSGESGILIRDFEIEKFRLAILNLHDNPQKRIAMGRKAHDYAQSRFSLQNNSLRFIALYKLLLESK